MKYLSCHMLEKLYLHINGRIDNGEIRVSLCCETIEGYPYVLLDKTAQETIESFRRLRDDIITESKELTHQIGRRAHPPIRGGVPGMR